MSDQEKGVAKKSFFNNNSVNDSYAEYDPLGFSMMYLYKSYRNHLYDCFSKCLFVDSEVKDQTNKEYKKQNLFPVALSDSVYDKISLPKKQYQQQIAASKDQQQSETEVSEDENSSSSNTDAAEKKEAADHTSPEIKESPSSMEKRVPYIHSITVPKEMFCLEGKTEDTIKHYADLVNDDLQHVDQYISMMKDEVFELHTVNIDAYNRENEELDKQLDFEIHQHEQLLARLKAERHSVVCDLNN